MRPAYLCFAVVVFAALLAAIGPAQANQLCLPSDAMKQAIKKVRGEAPTGIGLDGRGAIMELLVNRETGTWTALYTYPAGVSCIVGAGEGWHAIAPEPKGDPA